MSDREQAVARTTSRGRWWNSRKQNWAFGIAAGIYGVYAFVRIAQGRGPVTVFFDSFFGFLVLYVVLLAVFGLADGIRRRFGQR